MKVYLVIWQSWTDVRIMKAFSNLDSALAYIDEKNSALDHFDAQRYTIQVMDVED